MHCYEADGGFQNKKMSPFVLCQLFDKLSLEYKRVSICWFGGEPLIGGLDFFKEVLRLERAKHDECGMEFRNSIQSNGVLLTDEMIDFFKENNIKISFSYDCEYNDVLRQQTAETESAIQRCVDKGMNIGVISILHQKNYRDQISMIHTCDKMNVSYKFNRIFPEGKAVDSELLIRNEDYIEEMKKIFKLWLYDVGQKPSGSFSILLDSMYELGGRECVYNGCMFKWLAISPDGDLYTCPRFFSTDLCLGNFNDFAKLSDVFCSNKYIEIANQALTRIKKCASHCKVFEFCLGGCNAQSYFTHGLDEANTDLCLYTREIMPFVSNELYKAFISNCDVNDCVKQIFLNKPQVIIDVYKKLNQ